MTRSMSAWEAAKAALPTVMEGVLLLHKLREEGWWLDFDDASHCKNLDPEAVRVADDVSDDDIIAALTRLLAEAGVSDVVVAFHYYPGDPAAAVQEEAWVTVKLYDGE